MKGRTGCVRDTGDVDFERVERSGRLRRVQSEEVIDVGLEERDDL